MKSFPMFICTSDRRIIIVGGGEQAAQKARLVLKTDARIVLAAPELDDELHGLVQDGRAEHFAGEISPDLFRDAALVFVATGCVGTDVAVHALAKSVGALVNVVDRPDLCDAITPSIVDRDPVVVAIGTEGTAPVLGRAIKTQIETMLSPRIGALSALAGRLRGAVAANIPEASRRAFWAWVFKGAPAALHAQGAEAAAASLIKDAIKAGEVPDDAGQGHIALVGAGPGARDLLTLRAVARLQEADVIFYDAAVDEEVLELARRDARRVALTVHPATKGLPFIRPEAALLAEARRGHRVVRLCQGDPDPKSNFSAEGIPVEVVPGLAPLAKPGVRAAPPTHTTAVPVRAARAAIAARH